MKNPTLDIIVQTYNRAESGFFEKALTSVCKQTYQDFTIKVFDNGSTDNTTTVYERIVKEHPERRFEYKRLNKNHQDQYLADQKNEFITADYVIVFHDDDLMHPRYVECLMAVLKEHPELVMLGGRMRPSKSPENLKWEEPSGKYEIGDVRDLVKWNCQGLLFAYPTICYKSVLYKTTKWRHDLYGNRGNFPFLMDIAEHGNICVLHDRFLHYRQHANQSNFIKMDPEHGKNVMKKMAVVALAGDKASRTAFYNSVLNLFIPRGFTDYKTAMAYDWLPLKEGKVLGKKRKMHFLKYLLFITLAALTFKKILFLNKKAEKHFIKSWRMIKISADEQNDVRVNSDTRAKITVNVRGKNNKVYINVVEGTGEMTVDVDGNDNVVFVGRCHLSGSLSLICSGFNCSIEIPAYFYVARSLKISNGYQQKSTHSLIKIGGMTTIGSGLIFNPHSDAYISVGEGCMFSDDISIRNTDGHPIYDGETNVCFNKIKAGTGIDIGKNVWIGVGATLLKKAAVPDGCIVGSQAVVTKRYPEQNIVLAGNPARIVKRNIKWTRQNEVFFDSTKKTS